MIFFYEENVPLEEIPKPFVDVPILDVPLPLADIPVPLADVLSLFEIEDFFFYLSLKPLGVLSEGTSK